MTATERVREADRALAGPLPLPVTGLEAVVAGAVTALAAGDWWVPGPRERAGAVLREVPIDRLADPFAGARPYRVAPPTAAPGLRALHAVGLALGSGKTALCHLGIGSAADGAFHEALNLAALTGAPVIFLVAVHPLGGDAPLGKQLATTPARLAEAFAIPAVDVDGRDEAAVHTAVAAARAAGGAHLIAAAL